MSGNPSEHLCQVAPAGQESPGSGAAADYAVAAFRALSEGVVVQLPGGRIVSCNPAAERILGLDRDQVSGKASLGPVWNVVHEDGSPFPGDAHPAMVTLATGKPLRGVIAQVQRPDGSSGWISINTEPIPGPDGKPAAVVSTFVDLTDVRRMEEKLRRQGELLSLAQHSARAGMWYWDMLGGQLDWSPEMFRLFGLDPGREEATFDLWRRTLHPDDRELAERRIGVAVRLREFLDSEYRIVRPDGDIRWIQALGKVDYDPADQPVRMAGLCVDVTERKRAEESLRVKEAALASSINGIAISALTGRLTYVNDAFVKMWGYDTADEILGTSRFEYWQDANAVGQVVEAVTARGFWVGDLLARRRDGSTFQAQVVTSRVDGADGRPICYLASFLDVSQRRQAEEALRQSEERFRNLFAKHSAVMLLIEPESGRILDANEAATVFYGYEKSTLQSMRIDEINALPAARVAEERARALGEKRNTFVFPHRLASGEERLVEVHSSPVSLPQGRVLFSVIHDITERKRAEDALLKEQEHLRMVLDNNGEAILMTAPDGSIVTANPAACRMFGRSEEEICRIGFARFLDTSDPRLVAAFAERERTGQVRAELNCVRADGSVFPVDVLSVFCTDASGARWTITNLRDSTDRKKSEAILQASEARFRAVLRASPVPMALNDDEQNITFLNPAFVQAFGYTELDLPTVASWWESAYPDPDYRRRVVDDWQASVEEAERTGTPFEWMEVVIRTSDGADKAVLVSSTPLSGFGVGERLVVLYDITDRKLAEDEIRKLNEGLEQRVRERTAQLEESNKDLEAFSYSVSHDLRAPLRAIEGFSGILEEEGRDRLTGEDRRLLEVVRRNAVRMAVLIDDLLKFSRTSRGEIRRKPLDMKTMVRSVFEEVAGDAGTRARVVFRLGDLPDAEGDVAMLRQVWVNLLSNAIKYSAPKEEPVIEVGSRTEGGFTLYQVRDNGVGFDLKYADKLFGVFQRLHADQEFSGTGIGLALVKRIVERHGGRVWAEGAVGEGATFFFSLPVKDAS